MTDNEKFIIVDFESEYFIFPIETHTKQAFKFLGRYFAAL